MQIENEFTVPASIEEVWSHLLDVERVAPCMPGAELTESVDESTWKGKVNMRLGPVSLSFSGIVTMEDRDDAEHRVVLRAKGMEQRGKGAANASVTSWLEMGQDETTVKMVADVQLTGSVAQLSRGLLPEVSRKLTREFADCLRRSMHARVTERAPSPTDTTVAGPTTPGAPETAAPGPTTPVAAKPKPISGLRLGLSAIWAKIRQLLGSRRA